GEVARHVVEPFDPQHIIGRAVCAFLVRPEVDADHTNSRALLQTLEHDLMARAVEAESIDDGPFTDKSENARPRVPDLRARGDAADLGKAKSNSQNGVRHARIFVEPGCDADRIGKFAVP